MNPVYGVMIVGWSGRVLGARSSIPVTRSTTSSCTPSWAQMVPTGQCSA
jgi:hypothetical protein